MIIAAYQEGREGGRAGDLLLRWSAGHYDLIDPGPRRHTSPCSPTSSSRAIGPGPDPTASPCPTLLRGCALHVVTGKGGTGKTTVAAALALALAAQGRRVLLAEVEGRQGILQTFDVPPSGMTRSASSRTRAGGELWG